MLTYLLLNELIEPAYTTTFIPVVWRGSLDERGWSGVPNEAKKNVIRQETRSQAVARIADRTAKNCSGHVT